MAYNDSAAASGITLAGSYVSGFGEAGSEVVAYEDGLLYVTNGAAGRIDVIDAATMALERSVDLTSLPDYKGVNSVAVSHGTIAVAIDTTDIGSGESAQARAGLLALFDAADPDAAPTLVETGNHPDMVTFSADGTQVYVANEAETRTDADGEFIEDYATPAKGSITVVDLAAPRAAATYDFSEFDGLEDALRAAGIRIFPGASASGDFEPEYIAVSPDGSQLFVTLQEANAVAVFDLESRSWSDIRTLGTTDHSLPGNGFDASDKDDAIDIARHPVLGMRMADSIAAFEDAGQTWYITANEGDDRGENARIEDLDLDPDAFPDAAALQTDAGIGRLSVSTVDGDTDGDGDFDALYAYGARSFTIFAADGTEVFDSGDMFETVIARLRVANAFNNDDFPNDAPGVVDDNRSDAKGPEPEAVAVGEVDGHRFAFIGLERDSGIMIFNIDTPAAPEFAAYIESAVVGDTSPEVIRFIPAAQSVSGSAQLAVAYEVSGTTTLIDLASGLDGRIARDAGTMTGSLVDDLLRGNWQDNTLMGGAGDDILRGNGGDDLLIGGTGDDRMRGGAGADTFAFMEGDGLDRVWKFESDDRLDLSATGLAFEDLTLVARTEERTVVRYGDAGDKIVLTHAADVTLDADHFVF
ncbi:alkaline phosphatase [Paroceanicella profunda]|uniref:Alkaline phosphatase n=1 Tax=Paroceanicella profunda TaxID=2579971 RepID=A0A5B8FY84_9RHOB|nr:choice-of-anchor I family protein [Paroceanicella profunda]QDL92290.1 alkaline phosphatase [Paroceanicella profunda]